MVNHKLSKFRLGFTHIAFSMTLFVFAVLLINSRVFFVSDVGLRYLQIINLIEQDWQTFAINYPGAFIDDKFEFVPFYYAYSVIDQQIYLQISPFFPWISSILYKVMGVAGLAVVPVLSGIFIGWGIKKIVRWHNLPFPDLMLWLSIFSTPVLFYCLQIWDHTLGVAFSTWAIYFLSRGFSRQQARDYLCGGILLGFGIGQRPELIAFGIALGVSLFVMIRLKLHSLMFILGGLIGSIPIWILQTIWYGNPLGIMLGGELFGYGIPAHYPFPPTHRLELPRYTKIGLLLYHIDQAQPVITMLTLLLFIFGLFLLFYGFRRGRNLINIYFGLLLFASSYIIMAIAKWGEPLLGLISTFPLLPLCLLWSSKHTVNDQHQWQGYKLIGLTVAIFILIVLFIWPADGGLQWGARYLLPAYPLLFFMAVYSLNNYHKKYLPDWKKALQITGVSLFGLSVFTQILGVYSLRMELLKNEAVRDAIAAMPAEVVLSNAPYLQAGMASLDKIFLYVNNEIVLGDALERLAEKGIYQVAVIPLDAINLQVPDQIPNYSVDQVSDFVYRLSPK